MDRSIEGYKIVLYPKSKANQKSIIGLIAHEKDHEFKVPLILDDEEIKNRNYRVLMTVFDYEDRKYSIYLTQEFYDLVMSDKNYSLVAIWHEIGHIHNNHNFENDEEGREIRRECIRENKLNPYEFEADKFAVQMTSKSAVISFIDIMIRQREKMNDAYALMTINEYKLRKKAIQRL